MKKRIVCIVAAWLLMGALPAMLPNALAAETEGMWTTYRSANEYDDPDETLAEGEEFPVYRPEAGYEYTSEGFSIIPADYTLTTPFMTVQTKQPRSIKDGVYLQFRIDDYSYDGGVGADQWICLSLNTEQKITPGSTEHGGGWLTLIRGNGDGACHHQALLTDPKTEEFGGTFKYIGQVAGTVPFDENGREIYTLKIEWTGSEYVITVNDVVQPGGAETTALLEKLNANGEFYLGITMQAMVKNGTAALTILKYGTSEATATVPVGSDSKQPEENRIATAPIGDPSTVEVNKPAMLWSPETIRIKGSDNCTFTVLGDNTWRVTPADSSIYFSWTPGRTESWAAEDFPVFGIMLRNVTADGGTLWYIAGDMMAPPSGYDQSFSMNNVRFYGENKEYVFVPVDLTGMWSGRIHTLWMEMEIEDPENGAFDICFGGMFRSEDEAYAYAATWLTGKGIASAPETEAPATEALEVPVTEAPETEAPAANTEAPEAPDTDAPADGTQAPAEGTQAPDAETDAPAKKGCGGVIGVGVVAVVAAAAAAVALKKKD